MRRVLLLVLYKSLWLSLFWGLGIMWKGRRNGEKAVPAGVQRWGGILCALWLALPVRVSMSIRYRVEVSPPRENMIKALEPTAIPVSAAPVRPVSPPVSLFEVATAVWLAGAAVVFLFHIVGYLRACGQLRRWKTKEVTQDLGRHQRVRIAYSLSAEVPVTEGLLHPVVWLPEGWRERDCSYALSHEITHIRQGDVWVKWLLLWVKGLYWFHPLVFRFSRWLAETLEYACDEKVMQDASLEARREYSLSILEASGQVRSQMFSDGFLGFAEERSKMVSRIERIMNSRERTGFTWKKKLGMCLAAVLLTGCSVVNLQVEAMAVPAAEVPEMKVSSGMAEKADDAASAPVDNQDEAADAFQLEVFPCEAYEVVFPARYRYRDEEEVVRNELIFLVNPGTAVKAISDETVIETGQIPFYGKYVITENDGYQMRYCHLNGIRVSQGDVLKQGDLIGFAGTTGAATCHQCELRVERKDGSPVDLSGYTESYEGEGAEIQEAYEEDEAEPPKLQAVSFQLEVFPCEAYMVAFPTMYETDTDAVKQYLMFYANPGTEVHSVADEIVVKVEQKPYYGKYVVTENDGFRFQYSHLEDIFVEIGDVLPQGSLIGTVGATGAVKHYMCELGIQSKDGAPAGLSEDGKGDEW